MPDWVHLLPAHSVTTKDGRGPYQVQDATALMATSMAAGKLPIDENHATDRAAPLGQAAPARGWIVEMQQRADGIWGRVEWTGAGRRMMADREYSGISPAILHDKAGVVSAILRASLTNTPNLTGLTSLHGQNGHNRARLAKLRDDVRALAVKVAIHSAVVTGGMADTSGANRAVMQKARDLQDMCQRSGLPIDLASAVASVMEEDAPNEIPNAMDPAVISERAKDLQSWLRQRLGVEIDFSAAVRSIVQPK